MTNRVSYNRADTVKALLSPSPHLGGGGGGSLLQIIYMYFHEIHYNFPNLTITPIPKTEQEVGFMQHRLYANSMLLLERKTKFK